MEDTRFIPKAACVLQKMLLYVAAISTETRDLEGQEKEHRFAEEEKRSGRMGFLYLVHCQKRAHSLYKGAIQTRDGHLALNLR